MAATFATTYNTKKKEWSGPIYGKYYDKSVSVGRVVLHHLKCFDEKVLQVSNFRYLI